MKRLAAVLTTLGIFVACTNPVEVRINCEEMILHQHPDTAGVMQPDSLALIACDADGWVDTVIVSVP